MISSRPLHFPTDGNGRLMAKTPGRENAFNRGGKHKHDIATVQSHSAQPQKITKDVLPSKNPTRLLSRPLGDKTPFPNRDALDKFITPLPGGEKLAKLVLMDTNRPKSTTLPHTPDSVARPSSARKHIRAPRISAGHTNFVTPVNNGNHWDITELDIVVPSVEELPAPATPESDDYDEIEYMPPKVEISYVPPFDYDLPNYSEAGAALLRLSHSYPYDDAPPAEIEIEPLICDMPVLALPVLSSDDPFLDATPSSGRGRPPLKAYLPRRGPPARGSGPPTAITRTVAVTGTKTKHHPAATRPQVGGSAGVSTKRLVENSQAPALSNKAVASVVPMKKTVATRAGGLASAATATRPSTAQPLVAARRRPASSASVSTRTAVSAQLDPVSVLIVEPDPLVEGEFRFEV